MFFAFCSKIRIRPIQKHLFLEQKFCFKTNVFCFFLQKKQKTFRCGSSLRSRCNKRNVLEKSNIIRWGIYHASGHLRFRILLFLLSPLPNLLEIPQLHLYIRSLWGRLHWMYYSMSDVNAAGYNSPYHFFVVASCVFTF